MTQKQIIDKYKHQLADYTKELNYFKNKSRLVSIIRLLVFVLGIITFYFLLKTSLLIIFLFSLIFIITFLLLVKISSNVSNKIKYLRIIIDIIKNEINAINGNQKYFYNGQKYINKYHDFTFDLDIFGENSIFQLINRTVTKKGEKILAEWFSNPYFEKQEIINKQETIKEVSSKINFIQKFITLSLFNKTNKINFNDTVAWLESTNNIFDNKLVNAISKILMIINISVLFLVIFSVINITFFIISFLFTLFFEGFFIKKIFKSHTDLSLKIKAFKAYADLLILVENENFKNKSLIDMQKKLTINEQKASQTLQKFLKLNNSLDSSKNILLGVILNGIFLWDLNLVIAIEKYKKKYSQYFIKCLDIISELDAIISLSTFAYNYPHYTFPMIFNDESFILDAENIAHPLIYTDNRVANNFNISNLGEIKIITGANMAGKSTFLRTIGVNIVLAYIGLPVCADKLKISKIKLFTSMRTSDDLAKKTSYFHAELLRLKQLNNDLLNNEKVFIILDEILKGTNSIDKERGSKAFLEKIIKFKISGIVATHDLSLGSLETEHPDNFKNMSFDVDFKDDKIIFDYKLKKGITTKMNAYFLMKKMKLI